MPIPLYAPEKRDKTTTTMFKENISEICPRGPTWCHCQTQTALENLENLRSGCLPPSSARKRSFMKISFFTKENSSQRFRVPTGNQLAMTSLSWSHQPRCSQFFRFPLLCSIRTLPILLPSPRLFWAFVGWLEIIECNPGIHQAVLLLRYKSTNISSTMSCFWFYSFFIKTSWRSGEMLNCDFWRWHCGKAPKWHQDPPGCQEDPRNPLSHHPPTQWPLSDFLKGSLAKRGHSAM